MERVVSEKKLCWGVHRGGALRWATQHVSRSVPALATHLPQHPLLRVVIVYVLAYGLNWRPVPREIYCQSSEEGRHVLP
jgi:hypothetical protein